MGAVGVTVGGGRGRVWVGRGSKEMMNKLFFIAVSKNVFSSKTERVWLILGLPPEVGDLALFTRSLIGLTL